MSYSLRYCLIIYVLKNLDNICCHLAVLELNEDDITQLKHYNDICSQVGPLCTFYSTIYLWFI